MEKPQYTLYIPANSALFSHNLQFASTAAGILTAETVSEYAELSPDRLAHMDRASASGAEGGGFESRVCQS